MRPPCDPVVVPYIDVAQRWVAHCACGWSVRFAEQEDAEAAAEDHRRQGQPGGTDLDEPR